MCTHTSYPPCLLLRSVLDRFKAENNFRNKKATISTFLQVNKQTLQFEKLCDLSKHKTKKIVKY